MSEIAISLKNVSKCYKRYARPVDRLKEILLPGKVGAEKFWALQDIDLEIPKGETLGVVGRNGSGKSTLLQIVVGTLMPTAGEVKVNGRISALLELGSGFNPEFTGKQNIFFNGMLLGLSREEVEDKFDEVVAFADIGDFIDQPVKTYSSGMFVRLAFAVAISTVPDILVVDEALAVGDEAFQRKCFAQIQAIQARGGTILFVSHSASLIIGLCNSAVLIDQGEQLMISSPKEVISKYQKLIYASADKVNIIREDIRRSINITKDKSLEKNQLSLVPLKTNNCDAVNSLQESYDPNLIPKSTVSYIPRGAVITNPCITNLEGKRTNFLLRRKEYIYTYSVEFMKDSYKVRFGMLIKTIDGFELGGAASHPINAPIKHIKKNTSVQVSFKFCCLLQPGVYFLNAGVFGLLDDSEGFFHRIVDAAMFRVQPEEADTLRSGYIDFCVEPQISSLQFVDAEEESYSIK